MCAPIKKMMNLKKNKKGWKKFPIKSSWNGKILKNWQFNF